MHFRFMAAIYDLSLPVSSDITENMDDMSSELNDFETLEAAIGISTIHYLQVNVQCTSDLAATMLNLSLPVEYSVEKVIYEKHT